MADKKYVIGFANLSEESLFAVTVRKSLERAVAGHDNLTLVSRDNDLNDERAIQNVQEFVDMGVDVAIIFHINQRIGSQLRAMLQPTPVIAIDIPIPLTIYFGMDNEESSIALADYAANWINQHWGGRVDKVLPLVDSRVLEALRARAEKFVERFQDKVKDIGDIFPLDCGNEYAMTVRNAIPVFERWSDVESILAVGFNAETTRGLVDAAAQIGCEDRLIIVGHAADGAVIEEIKRPQSRVLAATLFDPAEYGRHLVSIVQKVLERGPITYKNFIEMELVVNENLK